VSWTDDYVAQKSSFGVNLAAGYTVGRGDRADALVPASVEQWTCRSRGNPTGRFSQSTPAVAGRRADGSAVIGPIAASIESHPRLWRSRETLLRASARAIHFLIPDDGAIDPIAVPDHVPRSLVPRKRLRYLTRDPSDVGFVVTLIQIGSLRSSRTTTKA
jgi:hypothetical protein